jgi:hypothetical protein
MDLVAKDHAILADKLDPGTGTIDSGIVGVSVQERTRITGNTVASERDVSPVEFVLVDAQQVCGDRIFCIAHPGLHRIENKLLLRGTEGADRKAHPGRGERSIAAITFARAHSDIAERLRQPGGSELFCAE